jgi:23S rRNA (cytidine1920-2'-O)/16S rRNA (cytidine1409-2'-O)-methyltransferase
VSPAGKIALDAGASTGGFVKALLAAGAGHVYAVDAGFGQLLGSLRQDPRVTNLERTNIGSLTKDAVPDEIEFVTLDLSYVSLAVAVPQLDRIAIAGAAILLALVKPMFELRLAEPPTDREQLIAALEAARAGIARAGWEVRDSMESPHPGAGGAIEFWIHARRAGSSN